MRRSEMLRSRCTGGTLRRCRGDVLSLTAQSVHYSTFFLGWGGGVVGGIKADLSH